MWSNNEDFFRGKSHGDTFSFDDSHLFKNFLGAPVKLKELRVNHTSNNVVGLQAIYYVFGYNQIVEGASHFGKDAHSGKVDSVHFEKDEYIVEISGRNGDIYDNLGFRTSNGRTFQFGGSGGDPFKVVAPYGKHFTVLRGGLGGHLHNLNWHVEPLPWVSSFQPYTAIEDQFFRGKRHGDTHQFSDRSLLSGQHGQFKIHTISVYYDNNSVYGISAKYFVFGPNQIVEGGHHIGKGHGHYQHKQDVELAVDEYITEIHGRNGDIFDNFGFTTNKGRKFVFGGSGGDSFSVRAPSGRHFAILQGGLGGHIHNIDFIIKPIYQQPETFNSQEFRRGKTHGDTVHFSDEQRLKQYPPTHKIWKLTVYHDRNFIFGWKADYFVFGPNVIVEGERHLGNQWQGGVEDVVELGADEFITEIFGRNGDIMDSFGFATSKGRRFQFGGSGGNAFDVHAPKGYHFGTLAGGLGGHVHNIEFVPVPRHHFSEF